MSNESTNVYSFDFVPLRVLRLLHPSVDMSVGTGEEVKEDRLRMPRKFGDEVVVDETLEGQ